MEEALNLERDGRRAAGRSSPLLTAVALLVAACAPSRETPEVAPAATGPESPAPGEAPAPGAEAALPTEVFGRWIHAREEDPEGARVYRPAGYALPPSRGRTGFELFADGRATLFAPGPADRGESTPARWERVAPDTLRITDADGVERFRIVVLAAEPERLLARIERGEREQR